MKGEELVGRVIELVEDGKAEDVTALDVRGLSSYADFIVIASGTSDRHVESIAERVLTTLKNEGLPALGAEGLRGGQWALVDLGDVVLHVFHRFTRETYDLEKLWKSAPRMKIHTEMLQASAGR